MVLGIGNKIVSPYGPRPRRSAQLIVAWVLCFLFILFVTWYITTKHEETARSYTDQFLRPGRTMKAY